MTLPVVERLREPWTQEQSRRPHTEHEAADTIEELVEGLLDLLSQIHGCDLRMSVDTNNARTLLAKIGGEGRKWEPHLDFAGEPMQPGEFRDPRAIISPPDDEALCSVCQLLLDDGYCHECERQMSEIGGGQ